MIKHLTDSIKDIMFFIDDPYSIICYIREDYFNKYRHFKVISDEAIYHEVRQIHRAKKLKRLTSKIKNNQMKNDCNSSK